MANMARWVTCVDRDLATRVEDVRVRVTDPTTGVSESVWYERLSRGERVRVLARYLSGTYSRTMSVGDVDAAVWAIVSAPGYVPHEWTPNGGETPAPTPAPTTPAPAPTPAPAQGGGLLASLEELIRATVADTVARATVNPDDVRDMVAAAVGHTVPDMVAALIRDLPTGGVTVRLPDGREARTVPGAVHSVFPTVWTLAVRAKVTPFLYGPAGTGKSTLARTLAATLGLEDRCRVLSVTADMGRHALEGYMDAMGNYRGTAFRDVFENGGVILLDELGFGTPELLGCLNDALASGEFTFPDGVTVRRHPDTYILAADNTAGYGPTGEYQSRQALDRATLDRFCRVFVGIDPALEAAMLSSVWDDAAGVAEWHRMIQRWRVNADAHRLTCGEFSLSPRRSRDYAALRAAGMDHDTAAEIAVWGTTAADVRAKVTA